MARRTGRRAANGTRGAVDAARVAGPAWLAGDAPGEKQLDLDLTHGGGTPARCVPDAGDDLRDRRSTTSRLMISDFASSRTRLTCLSKHRVRCDQLSQLRTRARYRAPWAGDRTRSLGARGRPSEPHSGSLPTPRGAATTASVCALLYFGAIISLASLLSERRTIKYKRNEIHNSLIFIKMALNVLIYGHRLSLGRSADLTCARRRLGTLS
jgi:hypothetical protein